MQVRFELPLERGAYSTPRIAEVVGVSIATVSRDVTALRQRGHNIRAEKRAAGWCYVLAGPAQLKDNESRTLAELRNARHNLGAAHSRVVAET